MMMTTIRKNSTADADQNDLVTEYPDETGLVTEYLDETGLESAAALFYQAFSSKFKTIRNMPEAQRQAVLAMFWQRGLSDPYDRHFQVKRNGKLVAVYGLTYGVKHPPENAPAPVSSVAILRKAGFLSFFENPPHFSDVCPYSGSGYCLFILPVCGRITARHGDR
nr:hypothetical protein [Morganella morganii]